MNDNYIREIQSLRGIAVILVFLFHINQELFTYGFIGVDIFFVISGFVISKIIYEKLEIGNFSFKNFFVSRILRLIPALFFMVLIVSFLILLTYQLQANPDTQINTGLISLLGLSNFYLLFVKNDYFNSFDENVFEHTWSLAIEFQFYLIYPFFLFFLYKFIKTRINLYLYLLTIIIIFFLTYNLVYDHEFFYNTEFRIWEFFIGCITFFFFKKKFFKSNFLILLSLLFFLIFIYTKVIFYLIIFICFFTAFIILNFGNFYYLKLILNSKILSYMGNISYSLYLWHLPVIFFASIFFIDLDYYFFSIIFSLILSVASFYFIEKPIRNNHFIKDFFLKNILTFKKTIFVGLIVILALFYVDNKNLRNQILYNQAKFYESISSSFKLFNSDNIEFNNVKDLTCHEKYDFNILKKDCFKNNNSKNLIYFFGDSSMHDYYFSFRSFNSKSDQIFSSYNNSSFWKPIGFKTPRIHFSEKIDLFTKKYEKIFLILSFNHKRNHELFNRNDSYFINQKQVYLKFANSLPKNVKIIFIKDTPHYKYGDKQCFMLANYSLSFFKDNNNENKCDHSIKNISKKMKNINKLFQNLDKLENLDIVDLDSYFCEGNVCSFYKKIESQNIPKKVDGTHLTLLASKDIAIYFNKKLNEYLND